MLQTLFNFAFRLVFRSYKPLEDKLKESQLAATRPSEVEDNFILLKIYFILFIFKIYFLFQTSIPKL